MSPDFSQEGSLRPDGNPCQNDGKGVQTVSPLVLYLIHKVLYRIRCQVSLSSTNFIWVLVLVRPQNVE